MPMPLLEYLLVLALVAQRLVQSFGPFLLTGCLLLLVVNHRRSA